LDQFGSALDSRQFEPDRSDVDLLVEFAALPPNTYADHYFGLQEALSALFQRPVDLVVERAIRNPYFRQSVNASREQLYAA
jgi:predicted nucleotidyltransferase